MSKKKLITEIIIFSMMVVGLVSCRKNEINQDSMQEEKTEIEEKSLINEKENVDEAEVKVETSKPTEDVVEKVDDGLISFRNIPWYSTKAEVEEILFENGAENAGWMSDNNNIYRMSGIDFTNTTTDEDRVDDGGYQGWYSGISVAGYEVSNTYACYIYPINDNGSIEASKEDAQFYFGWYTFEHNDFSDYNAIYDDLKDKLTSLYGEGKEKKTEFHTTITWKDVDDNQVRLLIDSGSTYITLGYMAAGADERLDEMKEALDNADAKKEADEREKNKENKSGL